MCFEKGLFSLAYAGSVRYYAAMLACKDVVVSIGDRRSKMSWNTNHCNLVGANGKQTLTLPILKPIGEPQRTLNDVKISEHGDWRRVHWGALFSAYGKSPFFEYISDELQSIYENHNLDNLVDFNKAIHNLVVDFLDLPLDVTFTTELPSIDDYTRDFRGKVGVNKPDNLSFLQNQTYWQVWQERHGFSPDLSIFDLLMNQGREAIFTLKKMISFEQV